MASLIDEYRIILGVDASASVNDIKKAYRKKAKEFHPDKNKSPNAHQIFIFLNEAYQFLTTHHNSDDDTDIYWAEETVNQKTEEDYRQEEARKRYEAFIQSDFYKNDQAFLIIFEHIRALASIIAITFPLIGYLIFKLTGFIIGLILTLAMVHVWSTSYKNRKQLNLIQFVKAIKRVLKIKQTQIVLATLLHIVMFLSFTIKTVIDTYSLLIGIITYSIFSFALAYFFIAKKERFVKSFLLFPFLFNFIFTLNYIFADYPHTETYRFYHKMMRSTGKYNRKEKSTYIILENDHYKHHYYLKLFYNFERMKYKSKITYRFKRGLFGFKVLKGYSFNGE